MATSYDVNANDAITWASSRGHVEVVQALLTNGRADPGIWDNLSIQIASINGHLAVVRALVADGRANPCGNNNNAIRSAGRQGHVQVVRLLLADGRAARQEAIAGARDFDVVRTLRTCVTNSAWFAC